MSDDLAAAFEAHRAHLQGVAFRMLGSRAEADDAVQEAWLRLARTDTGDVDGRGTPAGSAAAGQRGSIDNLRGWLTTVVARICLDHLRSRKSRREDALEASEVPEPVSSHPDQDSALADSVGLALLVVLDQLGPAERVAFVLHDMFAVPFDDIAPLVGRSVAATRQLASRARRRVQGAATASEEEVARQRSVIEKFLAALRGGDVEGMLAVLDPNVIVRASAGPGKPINEIIGAETWARGAVNYTALAQLTSLAVIDGDIGLVVAPKGRVNRALQIAVDGDRIVHVDILTDPTELATLDVQLLEPTGT